MHTPGTNIGNRPPAQVSAMTGSQDMYTRCPHCHTYFRIQADQIHQAQGKVRCGRCYQIFNAIGNLLEQLPEPIDKSRRGRRLPPSGRNTPPGQAPATPLTDLGGGDIPPAPTAEQIDDVAAGPTDARELILHPALELQAEESRPLLKQVAWAFGVVMTILVLAIQYGHFNRDELMRSDSLRPWARFVCSITGCRLPLRSDIDKLELSYYEVTSHPKTDGALLITAVMVNKADFDQPYPAMEIRLSDTGGRLVASRTFYPQEYLDADVNLRHGLAADNPLQLALEIADPGSNAVSIQFRFSRVPGMR